MPQSTVKESMNGTQPVACVTDVVRNNDLLDIDPAEERRIVRKLDFHLIPLMSMFYLLSFLDRTNIECVAFVTIITPGNARVAGLQEDLGLTDHQYQICVTVLYVPYIVAELPSNLLLRNLGPDIVMPTILTIWGVICSLQGAVTSYAGLVTIRAFLGLAEGPMYPGIVLYLSGFYTRKELSLRIALFFSTASLSGAFSGLLAAAIVNMDGMRGRPGWAWIFILEGVFTVIVGLVAFFVIPSTPQEVRFLTQRERDIVSKRLFLDRPTAHPLDTFSFREVWRSCTSPQVALVSIAFFMEGTAAYGLALFLPSIVNQLGYGPTHTQLLSVGPFAVGFVVTITSSYLSDLFKKRCWFAAINAIIAMVGYVVFLRSDSKSMSYGSLFLSVSGIFSLPPILAAWVANNSEPHYRRATSIAMAFISGNLGGILSTWRYPTNESPRFTKTTIMNLTFSALILVFSVLNVLYLSWATHRKNERRDELLALYIKDDPKVPQDGGDRAWAELGDKHPDFKYAL